MGNFLSGRTKRDKQKITLRDRAILDLKVQRDRLKQYQKKIALVVARETEIAKENLKNGQKERALLALRKKKYQEQTLEQTNTQLLNLEQMTMTIEFAQVEQQVFQGLRQGNTVLAELQKEMSLEDVEKLMADTADAIEYQNQISAMLSGKISAEEEEDVLEELAEIQKSVLEEQLPSVPTDKQSLLKREGDTLSPKSKDDEYEREAAAMLAV